MNVPKHLTSLCPPRLLEPLLLFQASLVFCRLSRLLPILPALTALTALTILTTACVEELPESVLDQDRPKLKRLLEEPPPPQERPDFPQNWSIQSLNGEWVARQRTEDGKICKVRVSRRDTRELGWASEGCLGNREDIRLLSDDGAVIITLFPEPAIEVMPLGDVEVGFLAQQGVRMKTFLARDFLDPASLRVGEKRLAWLKVRNGEAIVQHRGSEVELSLSSHRQATLSFSGKIALGEIEAPREIGEQREQLWPEACPPSEPCTYFDSHGVFHMVESGSLVPREYWPVATPIDGPVTEVGRAHEIRGLGVYDEDSNEERSRTPSSFRGGAGRRLPGRHPGPLPAPQQGADPGWNETPFERSIRLGTRAGAPLPERLPETGEMEAPVDMESAQAPLQTGSGDDFPK